MIDRHARASLFACSASPRSLKHTHTRQKGTLTRAGVPRGTDTLLAARHFTSQIRSKTSRYVSLSLSHMKGSPHRDHVS
jgi:hypothetical protein